MNTKSRLARIGLTVSVLCLYASGVALADSLDASKATIRYADLNLSTERGARILYERIVSASYDVCRNYDRDSRDNPAPRALRACLNKVVAEAVRKVDKPALYAVYNSGKAKLELALIAPAAREK